MNLSKSDYVRELLKGSLVSPIKAQHTISQAAVLFYHAEIPIEDAKKYMNNLKRKLDAITARGNKGYWSNPNVSREALYASDKL